MRQKHEWGVFRLPNLLRGAASVMACLLLSPVHSAQDEESRAEAAYLAQSQPESGGQARGRVIVTADPRVIQQARDLLGADQAEDAYQLLAPHEYEWAGDRDFDYLLGAAAVDTGRNSEAVLSLQRVLAMDPNYSAARMELARAYYNLGDYDYAKAEFRQLLSENPPDYARRVINNYLAAMEKSDATTRKKFQYFVEFDFGYDTNANGSTKDETFGVFTLQNENVEQDSFFVGFSHGGIWSNPVAQQLTNYNSFGFNHRRNFSAEFVNSDRLTLSTSLVWRQDRTTLSGGLSGYLYYLDSDFIPFAAGDRNSHGIGLDLGAAHALTDQWRLGLNARHGPIRYDQGALEVRDVDQTIYAASVEYFMPGPAQARVGVSLLGGEDDEKRTGSPFGRSQRGGRINFSWLMSPIARSYLFAGTYSSDYDGLFFNGILGAPLEKRDDRFNTLGWYLIWRVFPNQNWALVPRLIYTENDSNISLYEYDRTEVGLAIRWLAD